MTVKFEFQKYACSSFNDSSQKVIWISIIFLVLYCAMSLLTKKSQMDEFIS